MEDIKKPLVRNYLFFSLVFLILLVGLFFPSFFPYHKWLNFSYAPFFGVVGVPLPIADLIGSVFYWFFLILIPFIFVFYFTKRYIYIQEGKLIFIKLPAIALLISLVGLFISSYFLSLGNICSGEDCLGYAFLGIISIFGFIILSIVLSGFVYAINSRQNLRESFSKLDNLGLIKILGFVILFGAIVFLVISMILSYNCRPITSNFYYSYDYCQEFKQNSKIEREFFSSFPKELTGLIRTDVNTNYDGRTTYGLNIQNYSVVYTQFYYYPNKACLEDRCFEIIISYFEDPSLLNLEFDEGLSEFNESFSLKTEYDLRNNIFEFREQDFDGNKIRVLGTTTFTQYVWVGKSNDVVIIVDTNGRASPNGVLDRKILSFLLKKYPARNI